MWLFTKDGFFSVVEKPIDKVFGHTLTIRSRAKKDLELMLKTIGSGAIIDGDGGTDYQWRVRVTRAEWKEYLLLSVNDLNYENFKHEVQEKDKLRADVYLSIWRDLLRIADKVRRRIPGGLFNETDFDTFLESRVSRDCESSDFDSRFAEDYSKIVKDPKIIFPREERPRKRRKRNRNKKRKNLFHPMV